MTVTIKRSGRTNQFIIELRDGLDTIRCAVHIEDGAGRSEGELREAAVSKAMTLADSFKAGLADSS